MSETLRAENNPKFYSRFKWLGLAAIAFALYCLYDGYNNWPEQQARGLAFLEVAKQTLTEEQLAEATQGAHGANDTYQHLVALMEDEPALAEGWAERAEANGWDPDPPYKLRTDGDIAGQYVMAALSGLGAIWFLSTVALASGRWVELNEEGINTSWGESFSLDQVTAIDKRQWRDKGIARLKYEGRGGVKKFVVDDYKYHRPTTDRILRLIEQRVGIDKISGGPPEPDPDQPAAV